MYTGITHDRAPDCRQYGFCLVPTYQEAPDSFIVCNAVLETTNTQRKVSTGPCAAVDDDMGKEVLGELKKDRFGEWFTLRDRGLAAACMGALAVV